MSPEYGVILDVSAGEAAFDREFLERNGHPVLVCHGPESTTCPILEGRCDKLDQAHGVVFQLDLDRPEHRAVLRRYQQVVAPDVPLWAAVRPGQDVAYQELLAGVHVVVGEPGAADLDALAALVEAADDTRFE
ncbi:MAG TPA: hypothetical protein VGC11_10160 [Acidimicrobiia bacterium]|jgi:hypothetical protein